MNFGSYTDDEVAIAADLVNALTPGQVGGRPVAVPTDPAGWRRLVEDVLSTAAGRPRRVDRREAEGVCQLATDIRAIFRSAGAGDEPGAARRVNAMLTRYAAAPRLSCHDGEPWHLHFHSSTAGVVARWGAACATALAVVLGNGDLNRLGVCTAPSCDRVYVDTSRNGSRRFCSTQCMTRVKVSAYRARQAG